MFRSGRSSGTLLTLFAAVALLATPAAAQSLDANYSSAYGWVKPGDTYPFSVTWAAGPSGATSASLTVTLPPSAIYVSASPAPASGNGTTAAPLTWNLGTLTGGATGRIVINARAKNLTEDPEIMWKDLSASARLATSTLTGPQPAFTARTLGPKVTTLTSARYGVRPFPLVMVEYHDISHCSGAGTPYSECTGNHTAAALDEAVNSRTSGRSLWQLYNDMSFGQLQPVGSVRPAPGTTTKPFEPAYPFRFSELMPGGVCTGVTLSAARGTPLYQNRVKNGWYVLPGTQGYYGADKTGHAVVGAQAGNALLMGIDDACGPTGKIAYDAAAIADPDLDYNDYDTDKDGVVDFFNVAFAGDGGNGTTSVTGLNNVWPHKSDLRYYFKDAAGQTGYVSNDQLKTHTGEPLYWTDASRTTMTTSPASGLKVFVRVGPYNVNPESAIEKMSVIAHEYGHSLGLPDYYSLGGRDTFGTWELMASDHAQYMTVFNRQELGWVVPIEATDGIVTLRESKTDTGTIRWKRPDGTPYTLTGPGIHNADALRVQLPKKLLVDEVPSGSRAWHSGAGNDFGCPGHTLDVYLPDLQLHPTASAVTLKFKSLYEIEWDWDYGFVLASTDGGQTWVSLPSKKGTTLSNFNPNNAECYTTYQNGITGVSGVPNSLTSTQRLPAATGPAYPPAQWIDDEFDLTQFKGKSLILRFAYFTDAAEVKRGWFIDDIAVTADNTTIYSSDFEEEEGTRLYPTAWSRVSSADGVDVDHAYYIEVRDRIGWDLDGRQQSERGDPTWEPGVAIIYTDENHGYGNTGVANPPAQTIVDSRPEPGSDAPDLNDAAFVPTGARAEFDGCEHIDNYDTPDGMWKLPSGVTLTVSRLSGLSTDGQTSQATAELILDIQPDCNLVLAPPVIAFGAGHTDPDTDGQYQITWTRPDGAAGPDELQEATVYGALFTDDAESGLGNWSAASEDPTLPGWSQSQLKTSGGSYSFGATATDLAGDASATLTLNRTISVPQAGATTLLFHDWFGGEIDDQGFVEVSTDGTTWTSVYDVARSTFADQALDAVTAPMMQQTVDLTPFAGSDVHIRFRYYVGTSNYFFYHPIGWFVDDIRIETANWSTVATVNGTSWNATRYGQGQYFYRVRTAYPSGVISKPSPWSNVISTMVDAPEPPKPADLRVAAIASASQKGGDKSVYFIATVTNGGEGPAAPSTTEFVIDGAVVASVATPSLAPGGSILVTVNWKGADGQHQLRVTADRGAVVTESNESNNSSTLSFRTKNGKLAN